MRHGGLRAATQCCAGWAVEQCSLPLSSVSASLKVGEWEPCHFGHSRSNEAMSIAPLHNLLLSSTGGGAYSDYQSSASLDGVVMGETGDGASTNPEGR